jgi:uncharacterized membrane protein
MFELCGLGMALFARTHDGVPQPGIVNGKVYNMDRTPQPDTVPAGMVHKARRPIMSVTLWTLQVLMALSFVSAGAQKLAGTREMVDMFSTIGAGQWLRYAIGVVELAGAIGLLVRPLSGLAAMGLVGLMIGATATNLFVIDATPWVPVGYLVVAAIIARARLPRTTARVLGGERTSQLPAAAK